MKTTKTPFFFLIILLLISSFMAINQVKADTTYTVTMLDSTGGAIKGRINPLLVYGNGTYEFSEGTNITYTVIISAGYSFDKFAYVGSSSVNYTSSSITIETTEDYTITAYFISNSNPQHDVEFDIIGEAQLDVYYNSIHHQITDNSTLTITENVTFTITATPLLGYDFENYTYVGTGNITQNPTNIQVTENFTLYTITTYNGTGLNFDIAILANSNDYGTVTFDYQGYNSSIISYNNSAGFYNVQQYSKITIYAIPKSGYELLEFQVIDGSGVYSYYGGSGSSFNVTYGTSSIISVFIPQQPFYNDWGILGDIFGEPTTDIAIFIVLSLTILFMYYFKFVGLIFGFGIATVICGILNLIPLYIIALMVFTEGVLIILGGKFLNNSGNQGNG